MDLRPPPKPSACELCQRPAPLTKHHLVPKQLHGKAYIRKRFSRVELLTRILWVCRPCHNCIHRAKTARELALNHHCRDTLIQVPDIAEFVGWLRDKPAGFTPKPRPRKR